MKASTLIVALSALAAFSAPRVGAAATTIMDQIGPSGAFFTGKDGFTSQNFTDQPTYNIAAVDNFSAPVAFDLTNIQAAVLGYNGFTSYSNVTGYEINVYSSLAAANAHLNGDVAHVVLNPSSPGQVTVTQNFTGDANSALLSLNVDIPLPRAGTFYLSVLGDLRFNGGGELGVYGANPGPVGSNPDGVNAHQENPAGGFDFSGNQQALKTDVAYRVSGTAVPEPSSQALLIGAGLALVGAGALRRRRPETPAAV